MRLPRPVTAEGFMDHESPAMQIRNAMFQNGIQCPPPSPKADGRIHRFCPDGKPSHLSGWYWFEEDPESGMTYGSFGDWASPGAEKVTFVERRWNTLSPEDRDRLAISRERKRKEEEEERARQYAETAEKAYRQLSEARDAKDTNAYLSRKRVRSWKGLREDSEGNLLIPIYIDGKVSSNQKIMPDGSKRMKAGGKVRGGWFLIGDVTKSQRRVFLAEGYATAWSVWEATGVPCFVAFMAGNLKAVAEAIPAVTGCPDIRVTIVADNDASGTGEAKAQDAAATLPYVDYVLIPLVGMDANDYVNNGHNLHELLFPSRKAIIDGNELLGSYTPTRWCIRNVIPGGRGLGMVFGRSGSGKSFILIDMALCIVTGRDWHGCRTRQGNVLYLCGEGYNGVKRRVKGWCMENGDPDLSHFRISEFPLEMEIDSPRGRERIFSEIGDFRPDVIIVDTLARFMKGDENDTKEAKDFVAGADRLSTDLGCFVMIVHHTGQGDTTRERGSSVFRAACDLMYKVEPDGETGEIVFSSEKTKDGDVLDPLRFTLDPVEISDWMDEDGEPVHTAVAVLQGEDGTERRKVESTAERDDRLALVNALLEIGHFKPGDAPWLDRKEWIEWLKERGDTASQASNRTNPNQPRTLVQRLISKGMVSFSDGRFTLTDKDIRMTISIRRKGMEIARQAAGGG